MLLVSPVRLLPVWVLSLRLFPTTTDSVPDVFQEVILCLSACFVRGSCAAAAVTAADCSVLGVLI